MTARSYRWQSGSDEYRVDFVWIPGTDGIPYQFGDGEQVRPVNVQGFYLATTQVTQALWELVMGFNPARHRDPAAPVENVSWHQIVDRDGFLDRINAGEIRRAIAGPDDELFFRLPSETEWEYAARGGPHWPDRFRFSGSNDPDAVAWYGPRWNRIHQMIVNLVGWRIGWRLIGRLRLGMRKRTHPHPVATKAPNQLGIFDMSGNVWEWCHDTCTGDLDQVPADGTPYTGSGAERCLRGGAHENWDMHCAVFWRYGIAPDSHDGCIGFRLALGAPHLATLQERTTPP